jgi:flagellar motility protein MotE (MotC chaperone)
MTVREIRSSIQMITFGTSKVVAEKLLTNDLITANDIDLPQRAVSESFKRLKAQKLCTPVKNAAKDKRVVFFKRTDRLEKLNEIINQLKNI